LVVLKIEISKLKIDKLIIKLFENYEINIHIKNLFQCINEENYNFYFNYNIENGKMKLIFIYILIYEQFDLLEKIYSIHNNSNLLIFKIFLKDFFNGFFEDFKKNVNVKFLYKKLKLIK
jgi:hypothetical protein